MRRITATACLLSICLLWADRAPAQSGLKRLADIIRSQRTGEDAADDPAATEADPARPGAPSGEAQGADRKPGYLGLVVDDKEDRGRGIRVLQVLPDGPSDKAGLKEGDLITSLGGIRVRQMDEMGAILQQMRVGDVLDMEVLRGEDTKELEVTFGSRTVANAPLAPRPRMSDSTTAPPAARPPAGRSGELSGPLGLIPALPRLLQQPNDSDLRATIDRLQARIAELEARVSQLEQDLSNRQGIGPMIPGTTPKTSNIK